MKIKELNLNCIIWCKEAIVGIVGDLIEKYGNCECWKVGSNYYDYEISYNDLTGDEKSAVDFQLNNL